MKEIRVNAAKEGKKDIISMWFKSIDQLFDPTDPFPFPEKELTDLAEDTIFEWFVDLPISGDAELVLHIPRGTVTEGDEDQVANAVRRHYSFRLNDLAQEKKSSWREGQVSVFLAFVNATIGVFVFYTYFVSPSPSFLVDLFVGVFVIMNWVTIWDSYEYFLYDYRKLWRKYKVYDKLTRTPVVICQTC